MYLTGLTSLVGGEVDAVGEALSRQSNTLSSSVAPKPQHSVSLMLLDAVCSYLGLITIYVLFRLFASDQADAELFKVGRTQRGNFGLLFF